jgi:hypothetical protein
MSACYLCAIHNDPSTRPEPIGQCRCGIFTCMYDGARRHKIGEFECALCIVQVLLASAGVRLAGPDGGGGGGAALMAAEVRRFLGTEDFQTQCDELQYATHTHRAQWRGWLAAGVTLGTMRTLGGKLGELTGTGDALGDALVEASSGEHFVEPSLLADAAGVAQHAARLKGMPEELLGLSMAMPEVEQRAASHGEAIGAKTTTQVEKTEELKTMTAGG